jgi:predicted transglutaminase-like cysteine proteinase
MIIAGARALGEGISKLPSGAGMRATLHPVRNLDERMAIITQLVREGRVDPVVRSWVARTLTRRCGDTWCVPEKDRHAEIAAIFDEIRATVRYTGDVWSTDTYQAARHTLNTKIADCDDYTILACAALGSVGIPTRMVVIQTTESSEWDHIYLLAYDGNRWIPFDASVDKPLGWEAPSSTVRRKKVFQT